MRVMQLCTHTQVTALAFAPDGRTLAAGCADGSVVLWDLAEARRTAAVAEHSHRGPVWSLAFSHGAGAMLASGVRETRGCFVARLPQVRGVMQLC